MWRTLVATGLLYGTLGCPAYQAQTLSQTNATSANEKVFVEFAGETDLMLARLGQMAESRASDPRVKQFAHMMQQDHTQDFEVLRAVANKVGAIAPNSLDDQDKQVLRRFAGLAGQDFDRQFLKEMSDRHANAVAAYQREATRGFNGDLKAYAGKALPHLEAHLQAAQRLAQH